MVSLWDFLTLLCFAMPITGALAEAKIRRPGPAGYVLAIAVGVVLGICATWMMRAMARFIVGNLGQRSNSEPPPARQKWTFGALYVAATLWMGIALFLGGRTTALLLRFVS
jgi:hypothetical protein